MFRCKYCVFFRGRVKERFVLVKEVDGISLSVFALELYGAFNPKSTL